METGLSGLNEVVIPGAISEDRDCRRNRRGRDPGALNTPNVNRILVVAQALRHGLGVDAIFWASGFDPWFIAQLEGIVDAEMFVKTAFQARPVHCTARSDGLLRRTAGRACRRTDGGCYRQADRAFGSPGLQAHRYLRRRPVADAVHVFDLRSRALARRNARPNRRTAER